MRVLFVGIGVPSGQPDLFYAQSLWEAPSLYDFEAVVVDPYFVWPKEVRENLIGWSVVYAAYPQALKAPLDLRREETGHLLENGGIVVCILGPTTAVSPSPSQKTDLVTCYDWIPIPGLGRLVKEAQGERIRISQPGPFDKYLKLQRTTFQAHLEKASVYETLAVDEAGYPVAVQSKIKNGSIFLLPRATHEKAFYVLVDCLSQASRARVEREPPSWAMNMPVPAEKDLVTGLVELQEEIYKLRLQEEKVSEKLRETRKIRKLLFEQGETLEEAVRSALRELGMDTRKEGDLDLATLGTGERVIIEVTGSEGSIGVEKFRQLLNYLMAEEERGVSSKSILIGNHEISIPADRRGLPFTPKAIEQAKVFHTCLLPTMELFRAVIMLREGKLDSSKFRKTLLQTDGVFGLD